MRAVVGRRRGSRRKRTFVRICNRNCIFEIYLGIAISKRVGIVLGIRVYHYTAEQLQQSKTRTIILRIKKVRSPTHIKSRRPKIS
jgi:hypothetical protein